MQCNRNCFQNFYVHLKITKSFFKPSQPRRFQETKVSTLLQNYICKPQNVCSVYIFWFSTTDTSENCMRCSNSHWQCQCSIFYSSFCQSLIAFSVPSSAIFLDSVTAGGLAVESMIRRVTLAKYPNNQRNKHTVCQNFQKIDS